MTDRADLILYRRRRPGEPWLAIAGPTTAAECERQQRELTRAGMDAQDWTTKPADTDPNIPPPASPPKRRRGRKATAAPPAEADGATESTESTEENPSVSSVPSVADPSAELPALILKWAKIVESGKRAYQRADKIFAEVLLRMRPGDRITLADGREFKLVDNFADKNLHFGHGAVRRLELKPVSASDRTKRAG